MILGPDVYTGHELLHISTENATEDTRMSDMQETRTRPRVRTYCFRNYVVSITRVREHVLFT